MDQQLIAEKLESLRRCVGRVSEHRRALLLSANRLGDRPPPLPGQRRGLSEVRGRGLARTELRLDTRPGDEYFWFVYHPLRHSVFPRGDCHRTESVCSKKHAIPRGFGRSALREGTGNCYFRVQQWPRPAIISSANSGRAHSLSIRPRENQGSSIFQRRSHLAQDPQASPPAPNNFTKSD